MAANITAEMLIAAALATLAVKYDTTPDEIRSRIEGGDKAPGKATKSSKAQPETADDGDDETEEPIAEDAYQQAVNGYVEKVRSLTKTGVVKKYLEALVDWSTGPLKTLSDKKLRVDGVDLEAVFGASNFDMAAFVKDVIAVANGSGNKPAGRFNENRARRELGELFNVDISLESEEDDSGDKEPAETPKHKASKKTAETKTTKKVEAKAADPVADALTSLGQKTFIFWDVEGSASKKMFGILGENLNADVEKALLVLAKNGYDDVIPVGEDGKLLLDDTGDLLIGEPCSGKTLRKLVARFQG